MKGLSEHTILINAVIGLCVETYGWPHPLKDLGFTVDSIEPTLVTENRRKINPDLILTSNRLTHALVVECKGGYEINEHRKNEIDDQAERYSKISDNLLAQKVSIYDPRRLTHDITYVTNDKIAEFIKDYGYPVLIFEKAKLYKMNNFKKKELNSKFSSKIPLNSHPPTHFFPFNDDDSSSLIALYVFQKLVKFALKARDESIEFDEETILKSIFGPYWENIGATKKKALRKKVRNILYEYSKNKELKGYLEKVKDRKSWRVTKSLEAFRKGCQKIVDDLEMQRKIDEFNLGGVDESN